MAPVVRDEFRPTLPELLGPRGRPVLAVVAALVVLAVAVVLLRGGGAEATEYVRTAAPQFNLTYDAGALPRRAARPGELLRLEARRGDLFIQSFTVEPLRLPPYRGAVDGMLPLYVERVVLPALERRFRDFERLTPEGRARLNEISAGYGLIFRARSGKRRLYGRISLVPKPAAHPTDGVTLLMLSTPAAGVSGPAALGFDGKLKTPYRSFRFGIEKP
jgi:hypothetical protein